MIVAVTRFTLAPEKFDELPEIWDPLLKEAQKQNGLQKGLLLTSNDGNCLAIGIWDKYEDAKAWGNTSFYQDFVRSIGRLSGKCDRHLYFVHSGDVGDLTGTLETKKIA